MYLGVIKITKKKKKSNKKLIGMIVFISVCLIIGFILGYLSDNASIGILPDNIGRDLTSGILNFSALLSFFVIGFFLQIIIHEAGHLVFGLATGYSFVSFRIGSLTIVKENDKLKNKRFNIPGTAGQCLMNPPDLKDGKYPFVIYNLGGIILNLIVSAISLLFVFIVEDIDATFRVILILFSIAGIIGGLSNGIPLKISGMPNDGYNVMSMIKDDEAKKSFFLQLRVNALLNKGVRYKDMDYDLFQLKEGSDLSNPLNTGIKLMEYNWYLDNMDFENARICINSLVPYFSDLIPLYTLEINCERMFLELTGECNKNFIDRLYDKNLKKYIGASKNIISKIRLLMAYEAFYNKDKEKALAHYQHLKKRYNDYPIKGEADMELMLANWMKERMTKMH